MYLCFYICVIAVRPADHDDNGDRFLLFVIAAT